MGNFHFEKRKMKYPELNTNQVVRDGYGGVRG